MIQGNPNEDVHQAGAPREYAARGPSSPNWIAILGIWAIVFLLVWSLFRPSTKPTLLDPTAEARPVTPRGDLPPSEKTIVEVFKEAAPSVVYITSTELGRNLFTFDVFEIPRGTGSGFIYDREGHVVTNLHVIQEGSRWKVHLADESVFDADVVGYEADKDIAVLKIDAPSERLKPITLGTSVDLLVGQTVLAIGNPFGFDRTLTTGVVSALGREITAVTGRKIKDVVQTDAAINPGNSGGPLLDSAGRLVGINTQIASKVGESAGIGFAVPVDIVNEIVPDIIRYGRWLRPALGVHWFEDWRTRRLGIPGLLIDSVIPNSGADEAGLRGTLFDARTGRLRRLGDIIIKVDGSDVPTLNALRDVLETHKVGDKVEVTYIRNEQVMTAKVKLQYVD